MIFPVYLIYIKNKGPVHPALFRMIDYYHTSGKAMLV